jgi:predicted phosphodiesterase
VYNTSTMARKKKRKISDSGFGARIARSIAAIIILTAFILGISYFVKEVSTLDAVKVVNISRPFLVSLGVSEEDVGRVAGRFIQRIGETDLSSKKGDAGSSGDGQSIEQSESGDVISREVLFKVAIMADSHDQNALLTQALQQAEGLDAEAVFHLGDLTELGYLDRLRDAKRVLDNSGLTYYVIPGDRDLWWSTGPDAFLQVFEKNYHSVKINDTKFVMLDNSANYTVVNDEQMDWFKKEITDADFVLLAQPLYVSSDHIFYNTKAMGIVNGEVYKTVRDQAEELLKIIRDSKVKAVVAGDHHLFSRSVDPVRANLSHVAVGPIIGNPDGQLRSPQESSFSILTVLESGFEIENIVLE